MSSASFQDLSPLALVVHARKQLTASVCEFDLRSASAANLPPFRAGGSLIVTTPSGERRNYSIVNHEYERHRYVIAVKQEASSRGGSRSMHEAAMVGTRLQAELAKHGLYVADAPRHLLVAGGIGITPLLSLARKLSSLPDRTFSLIYLARSRDEAAYVQELEQGPFKENVLFHFSSESDGRFDLWPWLTNNGDGTHLYYCGPSAMMEHIRLLSIHWPRSRVHFENFTTATGVLVGGPPFNVRQASTGRIFHVGEDESILEALRKHGIQPAASCESGTCGKCRMPLLAGEADHRDMYLAPEERKSAMMPCVSRSLSDLIELDF